MFDISITKIFFTLIIGLIVLGPKQITTIAIFLGRYWKKLTVYTDKLKGDFNDIIEGNETKQVAPIKRKTSTKLSQKKLTKTPTSAKLSSTKPSATLAKKASKSKKIPLNKAPLNAESPVLSDKIDYPQYEVKHKVVQPMVSYNEALGLENTPALKEETPRKKPQTKATRATKSSSKSTSSKSSSPKSQSPASRQSNPSPSPTDPTSRPTNPTDPTDPH